MKKVVAYYRVSTVRQGRSGLGLEAQRTATADFLSSASCQLLGEFTEIETGKKNDRPELQKALVACRIHRATLLVAKLDRLSRNAAFLLALRDSSVEFIAADMPGASRLSVGILAMVAENEAEAISARTKAALAAARRRGVRLGNPNHLTDSGRRKGTVASVTRRKEIADKRAADLAETISGLRRAGHRSLRDLASALNRNGIPTAQNRPHWSAVQVQRLLNRIGALH